MNKRDELMDKIEAVQEVYEILRIEKEWLQERNFNTPQESIGKKTAEGMWLGSVASLKKVEDHLDQLIKELKEL